MKHGGWSWKVGVFGLTAVVWAMLGPGVATVQAQPETAEETLTLSKPTVLAMVDAPMPGKVLVPVVQAERELEQPVAKRRLRRLKRAEIDTEMMLASADVIKQHYTDRVGTEVELAVRGKQYVARVERHYHPPGGEIKPWGYHPGVSLFVER